MLAAGPTRVDAELEDERPAPASFDLELALTSHGAGAIASLSIAGTLDPRERVRALLWGPEREHGPTLEEALSSLAGPGATACWSGGAGRGRLTVLTVGPDRIGLEAGRAGARADEEERDLDVRLAQEGEGTRVTWLVTGEVTDDASAAAREAVGLGARLETGLALLRQELGAR